MYLYVLVVTMYLHIRGDEHDGRYTFISLFNGKKYVGTGNSGNTGGP